MRDLTINEFANRVGVSYAVGASLVRFMKDANLVEQVGREREEGQRGKGRAVYRFSDESCDELARFLKFSLANEAPAPADDDPLGLDAEDTVVEDEGIVIPEFDLSDAPDFDLPEDDEQLSA